MKCDRFRRMLAGLSCVVAALCLTVVFVTLAVRRKSVCQALLAVAAAGSAGAALLLLCDACDREDVAAEGELFSDEDVEEAHRRMREDLAGGH